MAELTDKLEEHYPLLTSLRIAGMSQSTREPLPRFLGLLLAAAESPDRNGCCFVFPNASRVACTAAMLLALSKLTREFDGLAREYAQRKFEPGQRVIVRPTGHVYEYTGVWDLRDEHPDRFRLQVLGGGGARSLLVTEILRLEPTSRKRPKGQVGTPLGRPGQSDLDKLLEIEGYGNRALFRNRIMCLTPKTRFEAFTEYTKLYKLQAGATNGAGDELHNILPWGSIREDGTLVLEDHYQAQGEPLLAITHSVESVAEASVLAEPFSSVVFADGPERLVRNLQSCDEITDSRKLIVVADHGSDEALAVLEERDFHVWRVSPEEMQIGRGASADVKSVFFDRIFDAASNYQRLKLEGTDCRDERLEAAADDLEQVGRYLNRFEGDEEIERCLQGLFRLLFRISDRCAPLEVQEKAEILDRVGTLKQDVERRAIFVSEEITTRLRNACTTLRELVSEDKMNSWIGKSKGESLLEVLKANGVPSRRRTIIATRYPQSVDSTRRWLQERGIHDPVVWYRHFPENETFDTIVVLSWLNSERFGKLVRQYAAPDVCLLSYSFERKWLRQFNSRLSRDKAFGQLDRAERSKLLGLPEDLLAPTQNHTPARSWTEIPAQAPDPFSIFDIEHKIMRRKGAPPAARSSQETCPTKYVGFVGEAYAYLTENHEMPVITGLVTNRNSAPSTIPTRTVNRLEIGDFLLFREGSDRDVVRLFAEEMMGPALYAEQRTLAASWRKALLSCGGSAREVHRHLQSHGLRKTESTVRSWLVNKNIIGPWTHGDVEIIAAAAGKEHFTASPEEVWEAVQNIRTAHRRAGHRISEWLLVELAGKRNLVADGEAKVDLDFGQFWIVEVEEVGGDLEQYPAGRVNRLLWEHGY